MSKYDTGRSVQKCGKGVRVISRTVRVITRISRTVCVITRISTTVLIIENNKYEFVIITQMSSTATAEVVAVTDALQQLYSIASATATNVAQHTKYNDIIESYISNGYRKFVLKYAYSKKTECPYWSDYWCGKINGNYDMLLSCANAGNPYAQYACTRYKRMGESILDRSPLISFLHDSAHCGVVHALYHYLGDLRSYALTSDSIANELLVLQPLCTIPYTIRAYAEVWHTLYVRTSNITYAKHALYAFTRAGAEMRPPQHDVYIMLLMQRDRAQTAELVQLRARVAQLEVLHSMSLDDVCKSVIKEYMS